MFRIQKNIEKKFVKSIAATSTIVIVAIGTFVGVNFANSNKADATLNGFQAGNIMSDATMSNAGSMDVNSIQNFLNSQNSCNKTVASAGSAVVATSATKAYYAGNPSITYNTKNGYFLCMSNSRFDANGMPTTSGGQSAAQIIYNAAQKFQINPQVLIVLLHKEQSLVTDNWPNSNQYQNATGYGCPDTAPCSSSNRGLVSQLEGAAYLFRTVLNGGWSNYPAYQTSFVRYSPDASCGGSNVYIANYATSALYRYTPYQPNAAALAAGVGTAPCGAYGNRNFYNFFTNWFGSTQSARASDYLPNGNYYIASSINTNSTVGIGSDNLSQITARGGSIWKFSKNSDGYYTIKNSATGKVLDVPNANARSGVRLQQYAANNSDAQKWLVEYNGDGSLTISPKLNYALALDVANANTSIGNIVAMYSRNKTAAQKFYLPPTSQKIADGTYYFDSGVGSNKALDIVGGLKANGTAAQIYSSNRTYAQRFAVTYNAATGYYTFLNTNAGKALDVYGASKSNGAKINIWTSSSGSCAQSWYASPLGSGYEFINACSGKALDVKGGSSASGTATQLYTRNGSGAQTWIPKTASTQPVANGTYQMLSKLDSNKALDVTNGGVLNGTRVQIYAKNNSAAQRWKVTYTDNGEYYTIINPNAGKALDVHGASTNNGANVQIYTANNSVAQRWRIEKNNDGTFTLINPNANKALDVTAANPASSTPMQIYSSNATAAQKWLFAAK